MSCGDCDWGCNMPGCGKKMSYCHNHYSKLTERLQAAEDALRDMLKAAVPHPVNHPTMWVAWRRAENLLQIPEVQSHTIDTSDRALKATLMARVATQSEGADRG